MRIFPRIERLMYSISDKIAPVIWTKPFSHLMIICEVCQENIVSGEVRDTYIMDQRVVHYHCPGCGIDHYLDLDELIPTQVKTYIIDEYNARYGYPDSKGSNHESGRESGCDVRT